MKQNSPQPDRYLKLAQLPPVVGLSLSTLRNHAPSAQWVWTLALNFNAGQQGRDGKAKRPCWRWSEQTVLKVMQERSRYSLSKAAAQAEQGTAAAPAPVTPKVRALADYRREPPVVEVIGEHRERWALNLIVNNEAEGTEHGA